MNMTARQEIAQAAKAYDWHIAPSHMFDNFTRGTVSLHIEYSYRGAVTFASRNGITLTTEGKRRKAILAMLREHTLLPAEQLSYPGGKDGMYRAGCTCGYLTGVYATGAQAEQPALEHITAKEAANHA